jgi:hypothetical protein
LATEIDKLLKDRESKVPKGLESLITKVLGGELDEIGVLVHLVRWDEDLVSYDTALACSKQIRSFFRKDFVCTTDKYLPGKRRAAVLFIHTNVPVSPDKIAYYAMVQEKDPAWLSSLIALLRIPGFDLRSLQPKPTVLGYGYIGDVPRTSDISLVGVLHEGKDQRIGGVYKFDNEGRSIVNFTLAVPVNKISATEYSKEDGGFFPKQVNKQSVYGTLNLYPTPVFLNHGKGRFLVPRAMVGIGLTGRPGSAFLIGGGWGISWFQFFVGSAWVAEEVPGAGGLPGTEQRYASRLTYGLNVPVLKVIDRITKKGDSKK